jgi:predicted PurR-regulated permease PerM
VVVLFTQGLGMAAIAAVVLLITQQIDGNIIQPKLMGGSFSLSPLLVIISITVGGAFAGILGMIAAIPIIAVLKEMLDSIIEYVNRKKLERAYIHKYGGDSDG